MIFKTIKQLAAAFLLSSVASFAGATPVVYNLGTLDTTQAQSDIKIRGNFDDIFSFIAGPQSNVIGSIVGLDLRRDLSLSYRFGFGAGTPSWFDSGAFTSLTSVPLDVTRVFALSGTAGGLLQGETYWINLTGNASRATYSLTLAPYSVPEPGSLVLMLLALGLVGASMRKRKPVGQGV